MEMRRESTGMMIFRIIIFIILLIVAIKVAFWILGLVAWIIGQLIGIGILILIALGIYYLLFGRKKRF